MALAKRIAQTLLAMAMLLCAWPNQRFPPLLPLPPLKIKPVVAPPPPPVPDYQESYLDISVNGEVIEQSVLVLQDKKGQWWIPVSTFEAANFSIPAVKPLNYQGTPYLNLASFKGSSAKYDMENLSLKINAPLAVFKHTIADMGASKLVVPTLPPWGGFLNYNVYALNNSNTNNINGLFGLTVFGPYGVGSSTFNYTTNHVDRPFVRLLTTWVIDKPDVMETLSLGDNVSVGTNWSGQLNYGGIQYGTNFNTQPAYLPFPLPGYHGAAVVPSALQLFINNTSVAQQRVAPGVFDITNIPMVDGYGNLRIITTDILGQQQVVNATYYINTSLLKKGLVDYKYEGGMIRQDLGLRSNVYSQAIGTATYALGITDATTGQVHVEALSYEQAAGATLTQLISTLGTLTASAAFSKSIDLGKGGLGQIAFQRQTPTLNFGASTQYTSPNFTQSGIAPGVQSPKWLTQFFASYPFQSASIACNYTKQVNRNQPSATFMVSTLSANFFHAIAFTMTWLNTLSGPSNHSIFMGLNYAFDEHTYINGNRSSTNGTEINSLQLIRQLPTGPGYGYDVTLQRGDAYTNEGSFSYQNDVITTIMQGIETDTSKTWSLNLTGAMLYMDHQFKFSRYITSSFGFVKTSGVKDVSIYSENQLIGITDEKGIAFVPNLLPYQATKVNIDPNTVPLNVQIDTYEANLIPYANAGVEVEFKMKEVHNASATLVLESGEAIPEGSTITIKDNPETFLSAIGGEIYLTGLTQSNQGKAEWGGGACTFSFNLGKSDPLNPIPNVGKLICHEDKPKHAGPNTGVTADAYLAKPQP